MFQVFLHISKIDTISKIRMGARPNMVSTRVVILCIFVLICSSISVHSESNTSESYTVSGYVLLPDGSPADATSVKLVPMDSVWTDQTGFYSISGVSTGEHIIRAYFMNNGHTVAYRSVVVDGDVELNWTVGKNWVIPRLSENPTVNDYNITSVSINENGDITDLGEDVAYLGPYSIGDYYTLIGTFDDPEETTQQFHFQVSEGSTTYPRPNEFTFQYGMNNLYGFLTDSTGTPMNEVLVSIENQTVSTNTDGFYLLRNLVIGDTYNVSFKQGNVEVFQTVSQQIYSGPGWFNVSSMVDVELPEPPYFHLSLDTSSNESYEISWDGGNFTEYFSVYEGEISDDNTPIYTGTQRSIDWVPSESGTFVFNIIAVNSNGSTESTQSFVLIVLPDSQSDDLWSEGMSWDYALTHTPLSPDGVHNRTITAISTETIEDAFGSMRESYLVRVTDGVDEEGVQRYRWVDKSNLLMIKTYWADAPSSSSYYQEGTLGWEFTDSEGDEASLLSGQPIQLHFNRTNVIGVPGHPNGYDDTINNVSISYDVEVSTPAGSFMTTYISITDASDGIKSWELWYNHTVRNWVKIIDRLPGSHSDSVEYVLTDFEVPLTPQFLVEDSSIDTKNFTIHWSDFQGTESYELSHNGVVIYAGSSNNYEVTNLEDGEHHFEIVAIMNSDYSVIGNGLNLSVLFVQKSPILEIENQNLTIGSSKLVTWTEIDGAQGYVLGVILPDGSYYEAYNGSANSFELEIDSIGQHRIRVMVLMDDGPNSDWSESVFFLADEGTNDASLGTVVFGFVLLLILLVSISQPRKV